MTEDTKSEGSIFSNPNSGLGSLGTTLENIGNGVTFCNRTTSNENVIVDSSDSMTKKAESNTEGNGPNQNASGSCICRSTILSPDNAPDAVLQSEPRTWRVVDLHPRYKEVPEVSITLKIRGEEAENFVPEKLYSSHKYYVTQKISNLREGRILCKLVIVDAITSEEVFSKDGGPIVKEINSTLEPELVYSNTTDSLMGDMRIQFTSSSYKFGKGYFRMRLSYFDSKGTPIFSSISPHFRVYARKTNTETQTLDPEKKKSTGKRKQKDDSEMNTKRRRLSTCGIGNGIRGNGFPSGTGYLGNTMGLQGNTENSSHLLMGLNSSNNPQSCSNAMTSLQSSTLLSSCANPPTQNMFQFQSRTESLSNDSQISDNEKRSFLRGNPIHESHASILPRLQTIQQMRGYESDASNNIESVQPVVHNISSLPVLPGLSAFIPNTINTRNCNSAGQMNFPSNNTSNGQGISGFSNAFPSNSIVGSLCNSFVSNPLGMCRTDLSKLLSTVPNANLAFQISNGNTNPQNISGNMNINSNMPYNSASGMLCGGQPNPSMMQGVSNLSNQGFIFANPLPMATGLDKEQSLSKFENYEKKFSMLSVLPSRSPAPPIEPNESVEGIENINCMDEMEGLEGIGSSGEIEEVEGSLGIIGTQEMEVMNGLEGLEDLEDMKELEGLTEDLDGIVDRNVSDKSSKGRDVTQKRKNESQNQANLAQEEYIVCSEKDSHNENPSNLKSSETKMQTSSHQAMKKSPPFEKLGQNFEKLGQKQETNKLLYAKNHDYQQTSDDNKESNFSHVTPNSPQNYIISEEKSEQSNSETGPTIQTASEETSNRKMESQTLHREKKPSIKSVPSISSIPSISDMIQIDASYSEESTSTQLLNKSDSLVLDNPKPFFLNDIQTKGDSVSSAQSLNIFSPLFSTPKSEDGRFSEDLQKSMRSIEKMDVIDSLLSPTQNITPTLSVSSLTPTDLFGKELMTLSFPDPKLEH